MKYVEYVDGGLNYFVEMGIWRFPRVLQGRKGVGMAEKAPHQSAAPQQQRGVGILALSLWILDYGNINIFVFSTPYIQVYKSCLTQR